MPPGLDGHGRDDGPLDRVVFNGIGAESATKVGRVFLAEAQEQATLGRDADPVAVPAEVVAVGGDKAYPDVVSRHPEVARRPAGGLGRGY